MKLNITIPVYNEERRLENGVRRLAPFLADVFPGEYELVIADNASTDRTPEIAAKLAGEYPRIRVARLERKGRGGALRRVWTESAAEVCSYMDVDMSSDLAIFPELVRVVVAGEADLAIGSRLLRRDGTQRSWRREVLSCGYNILLRFVFGVRFSDAQCGFKVVSKHIVQRLVPLVENQHWFFDTELLVLAEQAGVRIHDSPVRWHEGPNSSVRVLPTVAHMLRGIVQLRRNLLSGLAAEARRRWEESPRRGPSTSAT